MQEHRKDMDKVVMNKDLVSEFYWFAAKSYKDDRYWLPVWMHAKDTGCVMKYLIEHWLSSHTISYFRHHGVHAYNILFSTSWCARFGKIRTVIRIFT